MPESGAYKKGMAMPRPGELGALAVHEPRESGVRGAAAQGPADLGLSPSGEGKRRIGAGRLMCPRGTAGTHPGSEEHRSHCGNRARKLCTGFGIPLLRPVLASLGPQLSSNWEEEK